MLLSQQEISVYVREILGEAETDPGATPLEIAEGTLMEIRDTWGRKSEFQG